MDFSYIPDVITWQDTPITDRDLHKDAFRILYSILEVEQLENDTFRIRCGYFNLDDPQFNLIKNRFPVFEKDPLSLFKLAMGIVNPPQPLTIGQKDALTALMNDQNLNNRLQNWAHAHLINHRTQGQPMPALPSHCDSLIQYAKKIAALTQFMCRKAQRAKKLAEKLQKFMNNAAQLQNDVSAMLVGLKDRRENFNSATELIDLRKEVETAYDDYIDFTTENFAIKLAVFNNLNYRNNIHFQYDDFINSFEDKQIWFCHHFRIGRQLQKIFTDPTLTPISNSLDDLTHRIHQFQPDENSLNIRKAARIKGRVMEFINDFNNFDNVKTENSAKLLKSTSAFLLKEIEALSLQGINFSIENFGINREVLESKIGILENYLLSLSNEREKQNNENKSAASEISKSLSLSTLPTLKSPINFLHWRAALNRLFQYYKSDLSRTALIKSSIVRQTDKRRLDTMTTSQQMIDYLTQMYGALDLILPLFFKSLTALPIGSDAFIVQRNYEEFIRIVQLLKDNNIIDKLDRFIIESLVSRILMPTAREQYFAALLKKEPEWKRISGLNDTNAIINTNEQYEKYRREHFLEFAAESYETVRRLSTNQFFENQLKSQNRNKRINNTKNFSNDLTDSYKCIFCSVSHPPTLVKCPNFNKWKPEERLKKLSTNRNYCKKCLYYVKDWSNHKTEDNKCKNQSRTGACNKCHKFSHHSYLHVSNSQNKFNNNNNNNIKKTSGNQFKRPNRNSRFAKSTKVSMVNNNDSNPDSCVEELSQLQVHTNQFQSHYQSNNNITRTYVTCVTLATIVGKSTDKNVCLMIDSGSVYNFALEKTLRDLGYEPFTHWQGEISTITNVSKVNLPVFQVTFKLYDDTHVKIPVLGLKNIGFKQKMNDSLFNTVVKDTNLHRSQFANIGGNLQVMIGIRSGRLLPHIKRMPATFVKKYPDLKVCFSPISKKYFFSGYFTHTFPYNNKRFNVDAINSLTVFTLSIQSVSLINKQCQESQSRIINKSHNLKSINNSNNISDVTVKTKNKKQKNNFKQVKVNPIINKINKIDNSINPYSEKYTKDIKKPIISQQFISSFYSDATLQKFTFELMQKEALDFLRTSCFDCNKMIELCRRCRYLNSSLSLDEQRIMEKMLEKIRISENNQIYIDLVFNINPKHYFTQEKSNYVLALNNSLKLRKRLEKLSLLTQFHEVMTNDISSGYIEPISFEQVKSLNLLNYISLNFSQKPSSTSTKLRIVSNCSFVAKAGRPLNSALDPGPNLINSPNSIIHELRLATTAVFGDLEKAYRKLKFENNARNYMLFIWFTKPDCEKSIQTYRYVSAPFGLAQSGSYLELTLRHIIAQECKLQSSIDTITSNRYIDDYAVLQFENSKETLSDTIKELVTVHEKYNFKFKELHYTPQNTVNKTFNINNTINFLTLKVCLDSDKIIPSFTVNVSRKFRGSYMSSSLSLEQIKTLKITKKIVSKILGQHFSFSNFFLEPVNCCLKIYFTLCCKLSPNKWDLDLQNIDSDFVVKFKKFLVQLIGIDKNILPVNRCILPHGHVIRAVIGVADASIHMLGSILFLITEDKNGIRYSNIVDAKSKVSNKHTVASNECLSIKFCINSIQKYLSVIGKHITNEFAIHINNDSKSVSYFFDSKKTHSDILIRNCTNHIYRSVDSLFLEHINLKLLTMNYIPTFFSSADDLTKITNKNIVDILNSSKYRSGSPHFTDKNYPFKDDIFFIQERDKQFQFFPFYNYKQEKNDVKCKKTRIINCKCTENKVFNIMTCKTINTDIIKNRICHVHCNKTCSSSIHDTYRGNNFIPNFYNRISYSNVNSFKNNLDQNNLDNEMKTFDISTDFYNYLFSKFNRLTKLIHVLCMIKQILINFRKNKKWSSDGYKALKYEVFLSLIKKHQVLFPIKNKNKFQNTQIINGIRFVSFRLNFAQMHEMYFINKIPIFNTEDKLFLHLLIDHAHVKYNFTVNSNAHMTKFLTQLNMSQNSYAIFTKNIGKFISNFIFNCPVCAKLNKMPYEAEKSNLRFLKVLNNPKPAMFKFISMDTLPCITLRLSSQDRKSRNMTLYMIEDLLTGFLTCYLAENASINSTRQVLSNLITEWGVEIKYLLTDEGMENQISPNDDIFQNPIELVRAPSKCQQLNHIESAIKVFKRIFFSIFSKTTKSWPSLTLVQFNAAVILTLEILNNRPLIKQDINDQFIYFSPNSLIRGYINDKFNENKFKDFLRLQKIQEDFSTLLTANAEMKKYIFSTIKQTLAISTSKLAKKYYKKNSMLKPEKYDICLKDCKNGNYEICRIMDMNEKKNFLTIEIVKYGHVVQQSCHINNLSLLFRQKNN